MIFRCNDVTGLVQGLYKYDFHVMMYQVIGVPLGLVALDIGSDGNLLISMPSYLRGSNTTVLTNNSTENNITMQHNNSSI